MRQQKDVPKKCSVCNTVTTDIRKVGTTYASSTNKSLLDKYMCFKCTYEIWLNKNEKYNL
jgi:primosomal protein N'